MTVDYLCIRRNICFDTRESYYERCWYNREFKFLKGIDLEHKNQIIDLIELFIEAPLDSFRAFWKSEIDNLESALDIFEPKNQIEKREILYAIYFALLERDLISIFVT